MKWTADQEQYLRDNYHSASREQLETYLGRKMPAITAKANDLEIRRCAPKPKEQKLGVSVPVDLHAWLKAETPKGATLADTIRAIITDAYLDAQEARA